MEEERFPRDVKMPAKPEVSEFRHWPVLLATFSSTILTYGTPTSMGLFYIEWHMEYPESSALVGWLSSSMFAMLLCFSPLIGALTKYFGVRPVVATGALLSSCGLLMTSFVQDFFVMFITIPFITAIGFSMCYTSVVAIISECFHKHYGLATSITLTGASVGMVGLPFLFRFLIEAYGWRGALMVISALLCNVLAFAWLMKPPHTAKKKLIRSDSNRHPQEDFELGSLKIHDDNRVSEVCRNDRCKPNDSNATENNALVSTDGNCSSAFPDGLSDEKTKERNCLSKHLVFFVDHSGLSLLWTNRVYAVFLIMIMSGGAIYGITLPFLVAHAKSVGIPELRATLLISFIGVGNIASRVIQGRLVDAKVVQEAYIYSVSTALATIAGPVIAVTDNYAELVVCTTLIGLSAGVYIPLQATLIRQIVGKERFPGGFGVSLVSVAIGNMASALIGGFLYDVTGSYSAAFNLMGCMAGLCTAMVLGVHLLWTRLVPDSRWPRID